MAQDFPDIEVEFDDSYNPMIVSPNCPYGLQFYQTVESMQDVTIYKKFLSNCKSRFRSSKFYKQYKDYIMNDIGIKMDQIMPNVTDDVAKLEMHHNFLTLENICLLITEHILRTRGYVSTFDVVQTLKQEHEKNHIPIVILCETSHQMTERDEEVVLPAQLCFGDWATLLHDYNRGITKTIYKKIIRFIQVSIDAEKGNASEVNMIYNLMEFRENLEGWARFNEYGDTLRIGAVSYSNPCITDNSISM